MMNSILLIAQAGVPDVIMDYREQPVGDGSSMVWMIVAAVVFVGLGVTAFLLVDRPPTIVNTPLGLLHELCHIHRIKGRSRLVLEQIADSARLDHPATLFLGQTQFDAAVELAGERITLDRKQTAALGLVRRRLFESAS